MFQSNILPSLPPQGRLAHKNPAVTSWGPDRLDVFAVDTDNHQLNHHWCTSVDAWSVGAWDTAGEQRGGNLREQSPAATSWPAAGANPGRIDVFAVGAAEQDGILQRFRWQEDWDAAQPLPGQRIGFLANCAPAAVAHPANRRIDVFAVDNPEGWFGHRTLQHWWINGDDAPSGPESLGGQLWDAGPCALTRLVGPSIDVLAIGDDGTLQHWTYTDRWNGPVSRGGQLANGAGPCAVTWGGDRLDVFAIGSNQALQHWWVNGDEWNGPETLEWDHHPFGSLEVATPTAVSARAGLVDVFATRLVDYVFGPRHIAHWHYDAGWTEQFEVFDFVAIGGPTAIVREAVEVTVLNRLPVGRRVVTKTDLFAVHDPTGFLLWAFDDPDWVPPPGPRHIPVTSPARLPAAFLYQPYDWQFTAAGVPPYHWSADPADLPFGTHLNNAGLLHADLGQITTPGEKHFTVEVSDSGHPIGGGQQEAILLMVMGEPPPPPPPPPGHGVLTLVIQIDAGEASSAVLDPALPFIDQDTGAGSGSGWIITEPMSAAARFGPGVQVGTRYTTSVMGGVAGQTWTITCQATVHYIDEIVAPISVTTTRDESVSLPFPTAGGATVTAVLTFSRPASGPRWDIQLR